MHISHMPASWPSETDRPADPRAETWHRLVPDGMRRLRLNLDTYLHHDGSGRPIGYERKVDLAFSAEGSRPAERVVDVVRFDIGPDGLAVPCAAHGNTTRLSTLRDMVRHARRNKLPIHLGGQDEGAIVFTTHYYDSTASDLLPSVGSLVFAVAQFVGTQCMEDAEHFLPPGL